MSAIRIELPEPVHRRAVQLAERPGQRRTPLPFPIPSNQAGVPNAHCPGIGRAVGFLRFMSWRDKILSDPQILRGKPCIKGTRIPAALVLGYLAAGRDTDAILREFPDLTAADVVACLDYARDLAECDYSGQLAGSVALTGFETCGTWG